MKYDIENKNINNKYKLKNNNEIIFLKHKLELLKKNQKKNSKIHILITKFEILLMSKN